MCAYAVIEKIFEIIIIVGDTDVHLVVGVTNEKFTLGAVGTLGEGRKLKDRNNDRDESKPF